jgi:hypothetical protein
MRGVLIQAANAAVKAKGTIFAIVHRWPSRASDPGCGADALGAATSSA